ncbi:Ras-related protein Rab-10 [Tritrichomonas foetus]|uniref:Ras-related protein Rab-10 n=1 Tax=Tritrichomonas foetus TaxID=1144522 RepID=A0A1J4KBH0_9EUKA|nr:Ras-related protein Rab-10 [Tritrichomonas foetus]|eukprot:OHT08248.1 Ras-related protein Rab-10 [Tritrichomonas foetus]
MISFDRKSAHFRRHLNFFTKTIPSPSICELYLMMEPKKRKVIIVGDSNVGKTSVMFTYVEGTFRQHFSTIGAGERTKVVDIGRGMKVNLDMWDTAGQERYKSQLRMYCTNSAVAVLMFDLTDKFTFESLDSWYTTVKDAVEPDTRYFIVGNKKDLEKTAGSFQREGDLYAAKIGAVGYFETSAKTGSGIEELFTTIAEEAIKVTRCGDQGVNLSGGGGGKGCC